MSFKNVLKWQICEIKFLITKILFKFINYYYKIKKWVILGIGNRESRIPGPGIFDHFSYFFCLRDSREYGGKKSPPNYIAMIKSLYG